MCSLYAIFSLGAANYEEPSGQSPLPVGSPAASDVKTSEDYIALAKELLPAVYDEADIDSIRALAIMVSPLCSVRLTEHCALRIELSASNNEALTDTI